MLSRLASTAVTVRLHKQIFFESEATSMATFLWKVRSMPAFLVAMGLWQGSCSGASICGVGAVAGCMVWRR